MAMGTSYKLFIRTLKTICCLKKDIIKFPNTVAEQKQTCDEFSAKRSHPFPYVIGCIDGTHISISQPVKDSISFYNRKWKFSIVVQAIVDSHLKFIDVFIGCPGRCHDAAIWEMSPIRKSIVKGELKNCSGYHLLGEEEQIEPFNIENSFSQLPTTSRQREQAKNKRDAIATLLCA
ncbi:protein ALP1-like [Bactrocera tryoni]|uniref:protein ALP1-like n=1 Tax=Bactrocera tryoni TaxID=59916 RepID=UPI001A9786CE|nr:protein ALP1-like [Bactrocera tryoni]